jgi:hypothetical protein
MEISDSARRKRCGCCEFGNELTGSKKIPEISSPAEEKIIYQYW